MGETITCEAISDENHEPLEFPEGTKVLKGYLWSRRNTAQRKYELWDAEYAAHVQPRRRKDNAWTGFPLVHFPMLMALHAGFNMTPVASNATRKENWEKPWAVLSKEDREVIGSQINSADDDN